MSLEQDIKQEAFKSEYQKALINLIYTNNWVSGNQKVFFKQYNLTPQQYNILRILRGQYPKGLTIISLKERMLDKTSDASRLVDRLKIKDLIKKEVLESDKRATNIVITSKGLDVLLQIDVSISKLDNLLSNLEAAEVKQLNALLDKIRE
jgi:DNA-binding MarR family transcriptional regulator